MSSSQVLLGPRCGERGEMLSATDGQVTLEAHHQSARKILLAVQQQLDLLESGRDTSIELQAEISQHLNTLSREVQTLEELLPYAGVGKRSIWSRRVQQLKDDSLRERGALDKYATQKYHQQREAEEREALLQARRPLHLTRALYAGHGIRGRPRCPIPCAETEQCRRRLACHLD
jgi:hypothetical protein